MLNLILRTLLALIFVFTAPAYGQNEIFYNDLKIGREQESDISIEANIGRTNNPRFRYNSTLSEWEFSDDGVAFISLSDLLVDISGKADVDSPSFTGTPTAPTPLTGDDSNKIATTEFVQDAISNFGAGDVMGPESSTDSAVALFDGVTGKVLKNSSVTVDSNGSITTGSLWLGSTSQILSSTGTLSLGSSGVITRALGQFNAYGVVTSNITTDSASTGEDAVVSTPTTKVLRLTNGSLESILEIGAGLNSQELVLINSTGREIFLKTDGNISSSDGRATKLNNGSITSLLYDNNAGKWVISSGSGGGGISKWTAGTAYFIDDVVIYSDSIYQAIANSSDAVFDPLKWKLLSFDSKISNEAESFEVQNLEARRVVKTSNTSALIETDQSNLLINGSFEAQNATQDWSLTSLASSTASTSDVFDGKKKVCLSGIGSIFQMLSDTDKYHGRKFIARLNIQNPAGREAQACLYDGEDLHKCIDIIQSLEFREYAIKDTFIEGKTFGVIITGNELDGICTDMNSVKLDENEAYVAEVEGDYQQVRLVSSSIVTTSTDLNSLTKTMVKGNSTLFTLGSEGVRLLRDAKISITASSYLASGTAMGTNIFINDAPVPDVDISRSGGSIALGSSVSLTLNLDKGTLITFSMSGTTNSYISLLATARSQVINYPDETFSTDVNPVYWKATPCGEDEIGCYNTYPYGSGASHGSICTTPPTQTDAEIRTQGFHVFSRGYGETVGCSTPAVFKLVMRKGLSNPLLNLYSTTSREVQGNLTYAYSGGQAVRGALFKEYDSNSGVFYFDSGVHINSSATQDNFSFDNGLAQNNGYLVISATKNGGALVPAVNPVAIIKDVKPSGTAGGDAVAGAWYDRTLNTIEDPYNIVKSLSSNKITLPKGRYYIRGWSAIQRSEARQIRIAGEGVEIYSLHGFGVATLSEMNNLYLGGFVNLSTDTELALQYRVSVSQEVGLGRPNPWGNGIFSQIEITKLGD